MKHRIKQGPRKKIAQKLNPRMERFCHEYIIDMNATQAAKRAGYAHPHVQGSRLLDNVSVHSLIERLKRDQLDRLKMSADDVLVEIAKLARSTVKKVFGDKGQVLSPHEMDDDTAAAVKSFEARLEFSDDGAPPEEIRKVTMHDKLGALRIMALHHRLIGPEVEVNIGAALADKLAAARKRARGED
jgi:phage terminase small subunit